MSQKALPPDPDTAHDFRIRDRLNGWTRLLPCRLLEWSGWYNQSVRNRLIGHYRLYHHYKRDYEKLHPVDLHVAQAYILQYRTNYALKHFICKATTLLYSIITFNKFSPAGEYAIINRQLIYQRPDILQQFLTTAESDFDSSLDQAIRLILAPGFLDNHVSPIEKPVAIQYNDNRTTQYNDNRTTQYNDNSATQYNDNRSTNQYNSEVVMQTVQREGAQGKEKGVFSKKQHLILFDLLAELKAIERIDFDKKNKFSDIATLFHALTGKSKESFVEELNDYHNKKLYHYNTPGERDQLVVILTNLTNIFRAAGFRSIANLADKKIKQLETSKNT